MSRENVELVRRIYSDGLFDRDPDRIVHVRHSGHRVHQSARGSRTRYSSRRCSGRARRCEAAVTCSSRAVTRFMSCSTAETPSWPPSAFPPASVGAGKNSSRRRRTPGPSGTGGSCALSGVETCKRRSKRWACGGRPHGDAGEATAAAPWAKRKPSKLGHAAIALPRFVQTDSGAPDAGD
jgi:hypothetical protein